MLWTRMPSLISPDFVAILRRRFGLRWDGIHGAGHWARVRQNGLILAECSGRSTSTRVIELFAFLHDSCRRHDGGDPGHGDRAAASVEGLLDDLPALGQEEKDLLVYACARHSDGLLDADLTVQICWDADRLDLGRVGIRVRPERLCTPAARDHETLRLARERGERWRNFRW